MNKKLNPTTLSTYELDDGTVGLIHAEVSGQRQEYVAYVLFLEDDSRGEWQVHWTDGINDWVERFAYPHHAFAYLAALVYAADNDEFLLPSEEVVTHAGVFLEAALRPNEHVCDASCVGGPC